MFSQQNKTKLFLSITGLLTGIFLMGAGAFIIYVSEGVYWSINSFPVLNILTSIMAILFFAIIEEYIFRGWIQRKLSTLINPWLALLTSALLFMAVHLMNNHINMMAAVNIFLGGMVFGVSYMYTRSILYVIFFHFGWNMMQGPILGFSVSGLSFDSIWKLNIQSHTLLHGGVFGFEASIVCCVLLIISFILFTVLIGKQPGG